MVIVDTSIWVEAFRSKDSSERREVDRLLATGQVALVGPVLAEVLQGARDQSEFESLQDVFSALPYVEDGREVWARVGHLSYELRRHGSALGLIDLLVGALALQSGHSVYTSDTHFQRIPGLRLHEPGSDVAS